MSSPEQAAPPRCYVHGDRVAGSICRRCGRPICPDCMHEAPVGWQCTTCVRHGHRSSPTVRWRPRPVGGRLGNTRMTPVVIGLIVLNVAVFLWEQQKLVHNAFRFGMWPDGIHTEHQWYRLITAAFLHASWQHIIFNMITLAIIGPAVEAELGKVRFIALYLGSALGGSVASYLLSKPNVIGVGASGAIFGVMGAYFVLARRRGWDTSTILALIVINLIIGFSDSTIDWRAHVGGLLTGAFLAFGLAGVSELRRGAGPAFQAVLGAGVVAAAVVPLVLLSLLPPGHVNL